MTTGRYSSGPFRTGKTKETVSDLVISDMIAELGSSYSSDTTSTVMAEIIQYARAIEVLFRANNKLGNLYQPKRLTTEVIDRWSKALNIHHKYKASLEDKKAAISAKLAIVGTSATYQGVSDLLRTIAPNTFQSLTQTDWKHAHSSVAGGVDIPGGVYIPPTATDYWSSVHHVAVKMAQPTWMPDPDFYNEANNVRNYLDDFLPCWSTFDWYRDVYPYQGFTLADEANMDNSAVNLDNTTLALGGFISDTQLQASRTTALYTDITKTSVYSLNDRYSFANYFIIETLSTINLKLEMLAFGTIGDTVNMYVSKGWDIGGTIVAHQSATVATGIFGDSVDFTLRYDHLPAGTYVIECNAPTFVPSLPSALTIQIG
jgi:hypothetical protein